MNQFYFRQVTLDEVKYNMSQFQNAFKEWYTGASQGNYCYFLNFHGQSILLGRKVSDAYGAFIIIGYPPYANSIIELDNNVWTFSSLL